MKKYIILVLFLIAVPVSAKTIQPKLVTGTPQWCAFVEVSYRMRLHFNPELNYEMTLCK